jgi:hypothetical protein
MPSRPRPAPPSPPPPPTHVVACSITSNDASTLKPQIGKVKDAIEKLLI